MVRTLYRLVENIGENAVGKEVDILGEEAEYELVDEMGDAALVVWRRSATAILANSAAAFAVTLSLVSVGSKRSGSRKQLRSRSGLRQRLVRPVE